VLCLNLDQEYIASKLQLPTTQASPGRGLLPPLQGQLACGSHFCLPRGRPSSLRRCMCITGNFLATLEPVGQGKRDAERDIQTEKHYRETEVEGERVI
jgi:hypothetical protein